LFLKNPKDREMWMEIEEICGCEEGGEIELLSLLDIEV
jgi:hypothetical protein